MMWRRFVAWLRSPIHENNGDWYLKPEARVDVPAVVRALDRVQLRVEALEKDSHPPVQFDECPTCHAVLFEGTKAKHFRWHNSPYYERERGSYVGSE